MAEIRKLNSYKPIRDRFLDKRSFLTFEFPRPEAGGGYPFRITLPFFENLRIRETKKANYHKYDLLSRPSQLFTYTGSQARKFTLDFHMTYPHILQEYGSKAVGRITNLLDVENPYLERGKFLSQSKEGDPDQNIKNSAKKFVKDFEDLLYSTDTFNTRTSALDSVLNGVNNFLGNLLGESDDTGSQTGSQASVSEENLIDLIVYWSNIIRASTTNYSDNPIYGPPIVRINHGILFQGIPCICTDYTITPVEEGGYDLSTLLPRKIKYSMTLLEVRAGDFGDWDPNKFVARDNVVGWEAVVMNSKNTMDPGRFDLR